MPSIEPLEGARPAAPLAAMTTLGVGGPAKWFLEARTAADIDRAFRWSKSEDVPIFVLGGGSNLVVSDSGYGGLVLHIAIRGTAWSTEGEDILVTAGAGEPWDEMVAACVGRGLAGLECLSGIPGTVGGTPIQNVGAYGQEVASVIDRLTVYDSLSTAFQTLTGSACAFSYRMSRFKGADRGRFVVCDVTFRLRAGAPTVTYPDVSRYLASAGVASPDVEAVRNAILEVRRRKGMVLDPMDPDTRSVGSFFMNPVVSSAVRDRVQALAGSQPPVYPADGGRVKLSAAWLIERSGFHRGDQDGNVGISTKHTLALINRGGGTAHDVLRFATRIKRGVLDRFGIGLRPEPVFAGFDHHHDLEFLQS